MSSPLYLAFLWHMHQPYYKDPVSESYILPWVRLHAIKDYYGMPAILDEFPNIRQTFNLTPSLIEQLNDYTKGDVSERHLRTTLVPASKLSREDKLFVLRNFFMANFENMIRPYPGYLELFHKKGEDVEAALLKFNAQDFLDLQVWFNLAWFGYFFKKEDELLVGLIKKGKGFTEEEKKALINKQFEVLRKIIPKYKQLQEKGRIEISVTPYCHPILPLLCDTDIALRSLGETTLPKYRFRHSEDAKSQIDLAIKCYCDTFGCAPKGLWPSEGSVSEEVAAMAAEAGFLWMATCQGVLYNSLKNNPSFSFGPKDLFSPFKIKTGRRHLNMIFRDRGLSDAISFHYYHQDPQEAAKDLMGHLKNICREVKDMEAPLATIIMDGENAWEYYSNDGWDFLRAFYRRLEEEKDSIKTVTISDYLRKHPPKKTLKRLFPGSWIETNFKIWIGHREDNTAWDDLYLARNSLVRFEAKNKDKESQKKTKEAWCHIYIAEGSDWCWWYGDEHSSDNALEFDALFRNHLMKVYELIGAKIPKKLLVPIAGRSKHSSFSTMHPGSG